MKVCEVGSVVTAGRRELPCSVHTKKNETIFFKFSHHTRTRCKKRLEVHSTYTGQRYTHTKVFSQTCTPVVHEHVHLRTHTHVHAIHIHAYAYTHILAILAIHACTHARTHIHAHHTHTTRTRTRTRTHTHVHHTTCTP